MIQETFAAFVADGRTAALPPEAIAAAKRVVVDTLAVTIRGGLTAPATVLTETLAEEIDHGAARLYPSGRRAPLRVAALINGAAGHTLEFDDIFRDAIYHPGVVVIPAALAAAETVGASGEAFLRGVIAGYEVSNRIGAAVNPAHYRFWHTTGTIGHFGGAAAAASVLGLDAGQTAHALATATTMAAGLQQAFRADAMSKPIHAGQAAANGALAAMAAAKGLTGAAEMLEGSRGFGAAMCDGPDWERAVADLGRRWTIVETTQKNHTACGHTHAAIDAVVEMAAKHGLGAADVKRIAVATYKTALEVTGNFTPTTKFECQFSLPYCVAVGLMTGRARLDAFEPGWRDDAGLRDLMTRVTIGPDDEAEAAFPNLRGALVTIETVDGRVLTQRNPTRRGDPDKPLTEADIADKYWEMVEPVLGRGAGGRLLDALWSLETLADMRDLPYEAPAVCQAAE